MSEFSQRFNNLSYDERLNLTPFLVESQILHIEQCKARAKKAHRSLMKDYDTHINNLKEEIAKLKN